MEKEIYDLHLQSGKIAGEAKTCGKKNKYPTEEGAIKAANSHNKWEKRWHDVEPYPCAFCNQWHIGNIMPPNVMKAIIKEANNE
jgi:hypothetical protein